jgi:hypothetical protein
VAGSGTSFTTEIQVGDKIYRDGTNQFALIGTVASIASNTQLTLSSGAVTALTNFALYSHGVPSAADDVQIGYFNGTLATTVTVDGNFTCNTIHIVPNNGVEFKIDVSPNMILNVNGYVYIVSTLAAGTVNTLNVSGTFTAANLLLQGSAGPSSNAVGQLSIQNNGIVNIPGDININSASRTAKMIISAAGTGGLNMGGNFISTTTANNTNAPYTTLPTLTTSTTSITGTNTFASTSTINLNGVNKLQVLNLSSSTYGNVLFNNTGNNVATISSAITATNVLGDVRVQSGTVTNQGVLINQGAISSTTLGSAASNFSYAGNAGKTFEVANGATLRQAGVATWPTGFGTYTIGNTSTVEYIGNTQTIENRNFGNLVITAGTSTGRSVVMSGSIGIFGTFSPSSSNVYTITNSAVNYNGNQPQTMPATFPTYNNLTVTNASGITLGTNTSVNATLTFASGNITTGSNFLYSGAAGSVSRTSGHVVGNFKKFIATGATIKTFEIGDAANYTPVTVTFTNVSTAGDLAASTTAGDHPSIGSSALDPLKTANRYWALTNTGIAFNDYKAAFTFVPGDVDAAADPFGFYIAKFNPNTWTYPNRGTRAATSTEITGVTSFSDFQAGEFTLYVVPIKMVSFTAEAKEGATVLSWITADEQMVDYFEIQRSSDGLNFQTIGKAPAFNYLPNFQYGFEDRAVLNDAYYRIKTVGFDGRYGYSKNLLVKKQPLQKAHLAAAQDFDGGLVIFNRSLHPGAFRYRLLNAYGSQMLGGNTVIGANSTTSIPRYNLASGIYIIELSNKEILFRQKLYLGR